MSKQTYPTVTREHITNVSNWLKNIYERSLDVKRFTPEETQKLTLDLGTGLNDCLAYIEQQDATLRLVDELYSHAWDRADGGLSMFGSSVPKFEAAHKAVREALGIKLLAADAE